ncbi:MAG: hypothetical protein ABID84_04580 [Chloroflexota bacterium]
MSFICFDLEGPLSPQDNAYELMRRIPQGDRLFEVISRYDDLLAISGKRKTYQPGDTLSLIVPFLVFHKITIEDVERVGEDAPLTEGAYELVSDLLDRGWWVGNITTSYEQYGTRIAGRAGIPLQNVACTEFHLHEYKLPEADWETIREIERQILPLTPVEDDSRIKRLLDSFFWGRKTSPNIRRLVRAVKPLGGERKLTQLRKFAESERVSLDQAVVVGDSITDAAMLEGVKRKGGLAIAFNANEYALTHATLGVASRRLSSLRAPLLAWARGGMGEVEALVREREKAGGSEEEGYFFWLEGRDSLEMPLEMHRRLRNLVRQEAAKLG